MTGGAGRPHGRDRASHSTRTRPADQDQGGRTRFRTTLLRVLLVQVVALGLLWLLQATYHG